MFRPFFCQNGDRMEGGGGTRARVVEGADPYRKCAPPFLPAKNPRPAPLTGAGGCRIHEKDAQGISLYVERLFRG